MSKFLFVDFPCECNAAQGMRAIGALHADGVLSLYGLAMLTRTSGSGLRVRNPDARGMAGMATGSLAAGIAALLGGAGSGGSPEWLLRVFEDLARLGVHRDLLEAISRDLACGSTTLVAEVCEEWVTPLDIRVSALGGEVHQLGRSVMENDLTQSGMTDITEDIVWLKAEFMLAEFENKPRIGSRIYEAEAKAQSVSDRIRADIEHLAEESQAKLQTLQAQAFGMKDGSKAMIEGRIVKVRADREIQLRQLKRAGV